MVEQSRNTKQQLIEFLNLDGCDDAADFEINYKAYYKQRSNSYDTESPTMGEEIVQKEQTATNRNWAVKSQKPSHTESTSQSSKGYDALSNQNKFSYQKRKQPQERYGASPAFTEEFSQTQDVTVMGKAVFTLEHYSYYYYKAINSRLISISESGDRLPDILYSQSHDGEIIIEWNELSNKLNQITFIDFSPVPLAKQQILCQFVDIVSRINHPNLLNICGKVEMLNEISTIVFRSDAPDHISTWKQFCKTQMSLFHTLSIFRQLTSAIAALNAQGIIHRDVHPTRLHLNNGILKFNIIGLPYNFKKLMKNKNYSGHVSYSAPELISEGQQFELNSDTWSLGCCLYYLATKQDPFQGRSIQETKQNIFKLRLDQKSLLKYHNQIISKLVYQCLERDPSKRMTADKIMKFQDDLEIQTFGLPLSQLHFNLLLRQEQLSDQLVQRVLKDRLEVDYSGQSLALRNNPWFFSKNYTIQPLDDDQDFYFLIETKVGQSNKVRQALSSETSIFAQARANDQNEEIKKNQKVVMTDQYNPVNSSNFRQKPPQQFFPNRDPNSLFKPKNYQS